MSKECCSVETTTVSKGESLSFLKNKEVLASLFAWSVIAITGIPSLLGYETQLWMVGLQILGIVIGGFFFIREAIEDLLEKEIGVELLMFFGIIGAALLGEWFEALMIVGLFSITEALEGFTIDKTRNAIQSLLNLVPKTALRKRDGKEERVNAEDLILGDIFVVHAGESIATDGVIVEGQSSINQASVTGESAPVFKTKGDPIFAGTLVVDGTLSIEVTTVFAENTISKIIHLVQEAQQEKSKRQASVQRFAARISPIVLGISILIPLVLPFFGFTLMEALMRAATFVVAAAPCALAISIPVSFTAALGALAKRGILIKGGAYLEALAKAQVVAFDKTGTLTTGKPKVSVVKAFKGTTEKELLENARALTCHSSHPLDAAIREYTDEKKIADITKTCDHQAVAGLGITGTVKGKTLYAGSAAFMGELGHSAEMLKNDALSGQTLVFLATKEKVYGFFGIEDDIRSEAKLAIQELNALGIETVMLSGDRQEVAEHVATQLGIKHAYGDLKPTNKVSKIEELTKQYGYVAMVGDGINDAPALAKSSVGIAMGTMGTDAAIEAANVALMGDDLHKLVHSIKFARKTERVVWQNLILSSLILVGTIVLAVFMLRSISEIVFIHEFAEVLVILNGLRLLTGKVA